MRRIGRRSFARGVGVSALFSPFVSLLQPEPAKAAVGQAKYLMIFHTTGTAPNLWSPTGSSANQISFSEMLEPLSAIKDSLIIIEGLDSNGAADNHGSPGGLCGQGYSGGGSRISIDQFVGDGLSAMGGNAPFSNLVLGGVSSEEQSTFYRDNQALSPIFQPSSAFNTVFGGVGGGGSGEPIDDLVIVRRQSILDLVTDQLSALQGELGSAERQKLELHATSIRELEERLVNESIGGGGGGAECTEIMAPADSPELLRNSATHADLAATAFSCGLTNVAAIEFGHHQATQIGIPEIGAGDWHTFLHNLGNQTQNLINVERWVAEQFVATAQKLMALPSPSGGGSLYDDTLMIWTRGMGDGVEHNGSNMRYVLAGGAGGYLTHSPNGRYIQGGGQSHQRIFFNCCEAMGITDFTGFGATGGEVGPREPLSGIGS